MKGVRPAILQLFKYSQEQLAELAQMHFTYVSSVERGERNISLGNIAKLAKALECSIQKLVEGI